MAFKKGSSGNPDGRPPGAKNKVNEELREAIADFMAGEFDQVKKDFARLSAKDRMKFFTDLLPYIVPRLQNTTLQTDFDRLTDEQLDLIIEGLKSPNNRPVNNFYDEEIDPTTEN